MGYQYFSPVPKLELGNQGNKDVIREHHNYPRHPRSILSMIKQKNSRRNRRCLLHSGY
jgi:hypothetical protein